MLNIFLEEIIKLLQKELELLSDIKELSRVKTELIIENNIFALGELVAKESQKAEELKKIESKQKEVLYSIKKLTGTQVEKIDDLFAFFGENIGEGKGRQLSELRAKILFVSQDVKNINQLNSNLIQNSLEYIDFMLNLLSSSMSNDLVYQKDGQSNATKKNLFDIKL